MKRKNKFDLLPQEDRQHILNLCDKVTYAEACEILAKPRSEGGLSFDTGISNLCRFYTRAHPDAAQTGTTGQYCRAIAARHQAEGTGNTQAVLALTENRLIDALRSGKALADLTREYRLFLSTHKAWLAENKWRSTRTEEEINRAWDDYVDYVATSPTCDFMRNDIKDPLAAETKNQDWNDSYVEDYDMSIERAHNYPESPKPADIQRRQMLAALAALAGQKTKHEAGQEPSTPAPGGKSALPSSASEGKFPSKPPAIAHFPSNSQSPNPAKPKPPIL